VSGKIVTEKIMMTTCSLQKLVKLIVSQCCSRPSNKKKGKKTMCQYNFTSRTFLLGILVHSP
jgi:hypothetical protein